jgi:hypothetical protein
MPRILTVLTCLVALVVLAAACGGDDGDDDNGAPTEAPVADGDAADSEDGDDAEDPADQPSGGGSGTLVVDGKTFEVDVFFCGFTPEETRNDNVPFSMRGRGSDSGRAFTVDGSIVDLGGSGFSSVTHDLQLWYDDDELNPVYMAADGEWVIDGKDTSLAGAFTDAAGADVGAGTFEATCP